MSSSLSHPKPILIAGPTASGKSALAMALAERCNGVVINADSMQVYRELRILSARPTAEDEQRVPHSLYGHVPAAQVYSAGCYLKDVATALDTAKQRGQRPIIVGGTGLYFKVLTEGLSPIPAVPDDVRAFWRAKADRIGPWELHQILKERDPQMAARLPVPDIQRVTRALEVLDASGKSLGYWQEQPGTPVVARNDAVALRVMRDKANLYRFADARFDRMMEEGAVEEVQELAALGISEIFPAMRALGVAPLIAAIEGRIGFPEAITQAKAETRAYIKRQETWFRKHMVSWEMIFPKEMESLVAKSIAFIDC